MTDEVPPDVAERRRVALENLSMMLAGVAAVEEDRRLKDGGNDRGAAEAPPAS